MSNNCRGNTDIAKLFKVRHDMVAHCIKEHELENISQEPDNNNGMTKELEEVHSFCKVLGELRASSALRSKVIQFKQKRLRLILRTMIGDAPLGTRPIQ